MTDAAGERFAGLTALEAREAVVAALREEGRINRTEPYTHEVPYSQRSGERIEPLISLQWFMKMDELAEPAIAAVEDGRVRIHPEGQRRRYLEWLKNIRPWCISRQLWWGHQIPVWYRGDETYVGMDPPDGPGLGARPRRARHVVLERAVAVRDARLARRDRRAEGVLPDRRAARRRATSSSCGSPGWSSWGSSSPATSRSTTSTCTRSSRRRTGAGCRSRSARASTR